MTILTRCLKCIVMQFDRPNSIGQHFSWIGISLFACSTL